MFQLRKIQSMAIALAALGCFVAAPAAAQEVHYAASGVFVTLPVSGEDVLGFAGQPFTIAFVVNEATTPIGRSETMAEHKTTVKFTVKSGTTGQTFDFTVLDANLALAVGPPGEPDWIALKIPFAIGTTFNLTITAKVRMPAGTIATPNIKPFTAPVTLTPSDGVVTYACTVCSPPWTGKSVTLAIAGGTLGATTKSAAIE